MEGWPSSVVTRPPATPSEGGPEDVACWMIDTDHDGESFYARRIHFPGAGNDRQIKKLLKELGRKGAGFGHELVRRRRWPRGLRAKRKSSGLRGK